MTRHRPFYCGTQSAEWGCANCDRCTKGLPPDGTYEDMKCDIQDALLMAYWEDGTVSEDIAQRMGYLDHKGEYQWPCNEVEWTEAWKREWRAMHE